VQWTGRQAMVTLPQHIDGSNADQIREQLLWIINRGGAVLIVDLAGTLSCDYSGAEALARDHRRAIANGTELRLVVFADAVRRVLRLSGLDRPVAVYPDLDGALAAAAERRPIPLRCWSSGLTCSGSRRASTTRLRSSGDRSLLIRHGKWPNAGSSSRDLRVRWTLPRKTVTGCDGLSAEHAAGTLTAPEAASVS